MASHGQLGRLAGRAAEAFRPGVRFGEGSERLAAVSTLQGLELGHCNRDVGLPVTKRFDGCWSRLSDFRVLLPNRERVRAPKIVATLAESPISTVSGQLNSNFAVRESGPETGINHIPRYTILVGFPVRRRSCLQFGSGWLEVLINGFTAESRIFPVTAWRCRLHAVAACTIHEHRPAN